jgi:hypothetical protein
MGHRLIGRLPSFTTDQPHAAPPQGQSFNRTATNREVRSMASWWLKT